MQRGRRRRGDTCEACSFRLNGQGVIFLDGTRRQYLCRSCTEDAWTRRDAADEAQLGIIEALWDLPASQVGIRGEDGEAGAA